MSRRCPHRDAAGWRCCMVEGHRGECRVIAAFPGSAPRKRKCDKPEEQAGYEYARRAVDVHNDAPETSLRAFLAGVKWERERREDVDRRDALLSGDPL